MKHKQPLGKTKNNKLVFNLYQKNKKVYRDFTMQDHIDAAVIHHNKINDGISQYDSKAIAIHLSEKFYHIDEAIILGAARKHFPKKWYISKLDLPKK